MLLGILLVTLMALALVNLFCDWTPNPQTRTIQNQLACVQILLLAIVTILFLIGWNMGIR